ncbi:Tetratricopeptide repeat protein 37 [Papilio machaon]|uniref:Tetratricopeptide repeat protein 37 n=1 Tax=Papilio machaon TaxID=76193 RepID=A0A194QRH8_PAPMA|nr:Tetratricopeptide repeat protein 37 [Papilio machaon]
MTDIKSLLKEARKLIDEKNFKEAQECCKNILRKDKQNYLGLVLLGKALNESDQAPLAYQKAIAAKPDHPLAWVGLANYYERKDDDVAKLKLIPIYGEILKLQIDEEKALECITKLEQLGITLKKGKTLLTLAEFMKNIQDGKLHEAAQEKLLFLLKADIICEEEDISTILDVLTHIYNKEPSESLQILWGKLILQKQDFNNSVIEVIQLSFFSENVVLREMLCKYLCEKFVVNNSFLDFPIESYYEKITTGIENSKYPGLLQSMIYYSKGLYLEAYRQSVPLINYQEAEVTEATFIIRCTIKLKKWPVTQKLVTNFLTKVKDLNFANDLKKMLFLSLAEQKKWKHAVNIIKEFPMESLSISEQSYFAKCLIEINEPVDHIIQKLKSTEHYLELQALYYLKEKKYTEVITLLENENCNMLHFLYMGIAYWEQKQYEKCLLNLLKAAKMDSEHPDTFLYLGYYYYYYKEDSTLPSYPQSWIGQGIIAETIREEEAMDLFRHASRLGYHPESALGYADWVCRTLKNEDCQRDTDLKYVIEGLHAVTYAIDLVEWFSSFEPDNACACTILGILQERNGLLRSALKSYEKGFDNAEDDKKNITLLNIGRIQVRIGNYDDAINTYKAITEASLDSTCGLALALYKKGLYEEAYSAYDTALHWLSNNDNEKADLLVAMAGIAYMYKGVDDAKTLLFHSIQISQKKPTPYSLFAICSLGIAHSDQSLSKLALSELQKYEHDPDFGYDIGFLKSYLVGDDNVELGIKLLSDSLQNHPSNANLWFCLAQYCLKASDKAKIASRCAQRAIISARYSEQDCNSPKMLATASIAEHVAGDRTKAMVIAKEGLHMYPCQSEVWAAVLLSILNNKIWLEKKDWILSAIVNMRRNLDISRPLSRWVTLLEKKLSKLLQL